MVAPGCGGRVGLRGWAIMPFLGPLVESDEAMGEFVALGELADGIDRGRTPGSAIEMAAVVKDDVCG